MIQRRRSPDEADTAAAGTAAAEGDTPYADDRPLFIIGCPRSGTTLLRDLLRRVPDLICPEETHFYRWTEPFRTPMSWGPHRNNKLLERHRGIDGVTPERFAALLARSRSKHELLRHYITAFAAAQGITGPYRWFEKTPQNVFGAPLLAQDFPQALFVNMVRNPLNVVASLSLGKQVHIADIHGACNYWCEAVKVADTLQRAFPDRVLTLRYEDLVADVPGTLARVLRAADLPQPAAPYSAADAHPEANQWRSVLSPQQVRAVVNRCGPLAEPLGYDLERHRPTQAELRA